MAIGLAFCEGVLRVAPGLLPAAYLGSYPWFGVEFHRPGVLGRTPLESVPLPLPIDPWDGPPPADLVDEGIAPESAAVADRRRMPRMVLPVDELGLPNLKRLERADVVLVGDSFMVYAGMTEPPGLQSRLAEATGRTVYNLGIVGMGPVHEAWLLREVGLPLAPRLVLWFFFGGNDVADASNVVDRKSRGLVTHADQFPVLRPPRLLLPDLFTFLVKRATAPDSPRPLPPFGLAGDSDAPIWFHDDYLLQLMNSTDGWTRLPGFIETLRLLREARDLVADHGARLVMVFVPSKEQVHLPYVKPDADLFMRVATQDGAHPLPLGAQEALARALRQRAALEGLLAEFCDREGILFFSATPCLEELARRGESGFAVADTHWHEAGQTALLQPLLEFLAAHGL